MPRASFHAASPSNSRLHISATSPLAAFVRSFVSTATSDVVVQIPSLTIAYDDAVIIQNFILANPAVAVQASVPGTGPIAPGDRAALLAIMQSFSYPEQTYSVCSALLCSAQCCGAVLS